MSKKNVKDMSVDEQADEIIRRLSTVPDPTNIVIDVYAEILAQLMKEELLNYTNGVIYEKTILYGPGKL